MLFLFLKNLRRITLIDKLEFNVFDNERVRHLRRVGMGRNIVHLHDNENVQEYFVVRRKLKNLKVHQSGANETEIAIAIPINDVLSLYCLLYYLPVCLSKTTRTKIGNNKIC